MRWSCRQDIRFAPDTRHSRRQPPEASLIFSGRDRFTPGEARDISVFREANPNLTAWVRILNLISLLVLALVFVVGLLARI